MQDIHLIGGGGRFYSGTGGGAGTAGGGGGGDRRLRPQQHFHHSHGQQAQPPVLKCPRCDSANTKFCYYNNYNLSQPRHFCKSCRRYWTKGGVLRNVPVGGGCRKTKRSKNKANSSSAAAACSTRERKSSNSHSSSESSSLTATTNTTEAVSAPPSNTSDQSKLPPPPPPMTTTTANLEGGSSDCGLFPELGSFANLVANSSSSAAVVERSGGGGGASTMPFEFGSIADVSIGPFRLTNWNQQSHNPEHDDQEMKVTDDGSLMIDPKAQVDLSVLQQDRSNGGGFGSLGDWQQCGDQGLFDLTNTVDQAYWSQNQWNDQDNPSLYLP